MAAGFQFVHAASAVQGVRQAKPGTGCLCFADPRAVELTRDKQGRDDLYMLAWQGLDRRGMRVRGSFISVS